MKREGARHSASLSGGIFSGKYSQAQPVASAKG